MTTKKKKAPTSSGKLNNTRVTVDVVTDDSVLHFECPKWRAASFADDMNDWAKMMVEGAGALLRVIGTTPPSSPFFAPIPPEMTRVPGGPSIAEREAALRRGYDSVKPGGADGDADANADDDKAA